MKVLAILHGSNVPPGVLAHLRRVTDDQADESAGDTGEAGHILHRGLRHATPPAPATLTATVPEHKS